MTPKGERTRQRIIDVAMARFERDGFNKTTMRGIATEAEVAVGLAYRYFSAKEAIVLAFYERIATELAAHPIEGDSLGQRFASVMHRKLELLRPHRRAMGSLFGAMLDPESSVGILSDATADIREANRAVLRAAVEGAPGLPETAVEPLVRLAWTGQALLLLAWVQRPEATTTLIDRVAGALDAAVPFLGMPMAGMVLASISDSLGALDGR